MTGQWPHRPGLCCLLLVLGALSRTTSNLETTLQSALLSEVQKKSFHLKKKKKLIWDRDLGKGKGRFHPTGRRHPQEAGACPSWAPIRTGVSPLSSCAREEGAGEQA